MTTCLLRPSKKRRASEESREVRRGGRGRHRDPPRHGSRGLRDGDVDVRRQHVVDDEHRERGAEEQAEQAEAHDQHFAQHVRPHDDGQRPDGVERVQVHAHWGSQYGIAVGLFPAFPRGFLLRLS